MDLQKIILFFIFFSFFILSHAMKKNERHEYRSEKNNYRNRDRGRRNNTSMRYQFFNDQHQYHNQCQRDNHDWYKSSSFDDTRGGYRSRDRSRRRNSGVSRQKQSNRAYKRPLYPNCTGTRDNHKRHDLPYRKYRKFEKKKHTLGRRITRNGYKDMRRHGNMRIFQQLKQQQVYNNFVPKQEVFDKNKKIQKHDNWRDAVLRADIEKLQSFSADIMKDEMWYALFQLAVWGNYNLYEKKIANKRSAKQKRMDVILCFINMPGALDCLRQGNEKDKQENMCNNEIMYNAIVNGDIEKIEKCASYIIMHERWHEALKIALYAQYTYKSAEKIIDSSLIREKVVKCLLRILFFDYRSYWFDQEQEKRYQVDFSDCLNCLIVDGFYKASALHIAATKGYYDIFKKILCKYADIFTLDSVGENVLHKVIKSQEVKSEFNRRAVARIIFDAILECKSKVIINENGEKSFQVNDPDFFNKKIPWGSKNELITPLHLAVYLGQICIAENLLYVGVDIFPMYDGKTLLHEILLTPYIQKENVREELVKKILEKLTCASKEVQEGFLKMRMRFYKNGQESCRSSAFDIARLKGYKMIEEVLKQFVKNNREK